MTGCATVPEYSVGWVDTYIMFGDFVVDGECLVDGDFRELQRVAPKVTEQRKEMPVPEGVDEEPQPPGDYF